MIVVYALLLLSSYSSIIIQSCPIGVWTGILKGSVMDLGCMEQKGQKGTRRCPQGHKIYYVYYVMSVNTKHWAYCFLPGRYAGNWKGEKHMVNYPLLMSTLSHPRHLKNALMQPSLLLHTTGWKLSIYQPHNNLWCVSQSLRNDGTVTPAANFSPSGDAGILDKAIKTKGEF